MSTATDPRTLDKLCIDTIRTLSMDGVQKANSGHPGTPMALAPIAYVLYTRVMRHNPEDPKWLNRDRFVLTARPRLDAALLDALPHGLRPDARRPQELPPARQPDRRPSRVRPRGGHRGDHRPAGPGHLQRRRHGAGRAHVGRALQPAGPRDRRPLHLRRSPPTATSRRASRPRPARSPATSGSGKLIAFYDDNHISIEGDTALSLSEDTGKRYEAYGWHVEDIGEIGADFDPDWLEAAIDRAKAVEDRPSLLIVQHPHRLGRAQQAGHRGRARVAPRRRGGQAHQGGLRLADRRALLRARRGARSTSATLHRPRPRAARRSGSARRGVARRAPGPGRASSTA